MLLASLNTILAELIIPVRVSGGFFATDNLQVQVTVSNLDQQALELVCVCFPADFH